MHMNIVEENIYLPFLTKRKISPFLEDKKIENAYHFLFYITFSTTLFLVPIFLFQQRVRIKIILPIIPKIFLTQILLNCSILDI